MWHTATSNNSEDVKVSRHLKTNFLVVSLSVPRHSLTFGSRAFRLSDPRVWIHYLSVFMKLNHSHFQTLFKITLFSVSLSSFSCPSCLEYLSSMRPNSSKDLAIYKPFAYLLTCSISVSKVLVSVSRPSEMHWDQTGNVAGNANNF